MISQQRICETDAIHQSDLLDVNHYNLHRGIWSPVIEHGDIITGYWMPGNNYQKDNDYYGGYPRDYLKRLRILFPQAANVLHLFSGMVKLGNWPSETRIDINPKLEAEYYLNAENIGELEINNFDCIFADPPYEQNHTKYGTETVNKKKVVKGCSKILRLGGYLIWLDTRIPIWAKSDGWKLRGTIGLVQSTNCLTKTITILRKERA